MKNDTYNDSTNNIGLNWVWLDNGVHKNSIKPQ